MIQQMTEAMVLTHRHEISYLLRLCFQHTFCESDEALIDSKVESLIQHIRDGNALPFASIDQDTVNGFVWAYPLDTPLGTCIHVGYIAVSEEAQGKGIGHQLLNMVEQKAKEMGIDKTELIVGGNNHQAQRFYAMLGYHMDRLILHKDLG